MKKMICIMVAFLLLFFSVPFHGFSTEIPYTTQQLQDMDFYELIGVMDELSLGAEGEETIGFGYLLAEKIKQVPAGDVERIIFDEEHCCGARLVLVMLASELNIDLDTAKMRALAADKQEDNALRAYALDYLSDLQPFDEALFCEIAGDAEDPISSWALKLLYLNTQDAGITLIDGILSSYDGGALDDREATALLYKGYDLNISGDVQEVKSFLALCGKILEADPEDKNGDRSTVYYAISNVGSKESLSFLLQQDSVEDHILSLAVYDAGSDIVYALYDEAENQRAFAAIMRKANYPLIGDVNDDNAVTAEDARHILRQAVHLEPVFTDRRAISDLDADNAVRAQDARLALRTAVWLEKAVFMGLPR